jgi:hypothetical protein
VLRAPDPAPFPLRTHPGLQLRARLPFGAIITALNVCGRQLQGQVSRAVSDLAKAVANCAQVSADSNLSMSDSNQQGVRINLRRMDLSAFINYPP